MRTLISIGLIVCLTGCSMSKMMQAFYGDHYQYKYSLNGSQPDTVMRFEDQSMDFTFLITDKEINFTAKNKTSETVRVYWDEASLVQFGKANNVMHKGIKYADRNGSKPMTSIPPGAMLDDLVVPTENIYYREGTYSTYVSTSGGWETKDLYINYAKDDDPKTKDAIQMMKGQELTLYLPVKTVTGKELGYTFKFKVEDIKCTSCKEKKPEAPKKKKK